MIDTKGMITVTETAKRLNLSIEQVRRKLRAGKLKGQRVGNQWFADELDVAKQAKLRSKSARNLKRLQRIPRVRKLVALAGVNKGEKPLPLVSPEAMAEVDATARRIAERNPEYVFDPVEMVRRSREGH